jgi:hypothetical protein
LILRGLKASGENSGGLLLSVQENREEGRQESRQEGEEIQALILRGLKASGENSGGLLLSVQDNLSRKSVDLPPGLLAHAFAASGRTRVSPLSPPDVQPAGFAEFAAMTSPVFLGKARGLGR